MQSNVIPIWMTSFVYAPFRHLLWQAFTIVQFALWIVNGKWIFCFQKIRKTNMMIQIKTMRLYPNRTEVLCCIALYCTEPNGVYEMCCCILTSFASYTNLRPSAACTNKKEHNRIDITVNPCVCRMLTILNASIGWKSKKQMTNTETLIDLDLFSPITMLNFYWRKKHIQRTTFTYSTHFECDREHFGFFLEKWNWVFFSELMTILTTVWNRLVLFFSLKNI